MINLDIFCADTIFDSLNGYISQINLLDNINPSASNSQEFRSRTLGIISISHQSEYKKVDIIKDDLKLYSAEKNEQWSIEANLLSSQQISAIENLPQTKEDILVEFYSRSLTLQLKAIFQDKKYPLNKIVSLCQAAIPYDFQISQESTPKKLIFLGTLYSEKELVFSSSFCTLQFSQNYQVHVLQNDIPLEHLSQLCC